MIDLRGDVLGAVADLTTRTTTPSTLAVFDWVTGKRALRGDRDPGGGPAPWFGLAPVFRALQAEGLIEISSADGTSRAGALSRTEAAAPRDSALRVQLTELGEHELDREWGRRRGLGARQQCPHDRERS